MSSAGKTLKELYSSLMHVTCVARLLHNCAMRVRAHFKNIDEVIATIKAATIKNKDRKKDFHDAGLPSPPDPVITRWATWFRAALYYFIYLFSCMFILLSRESDQCAIRARLVVASHLSTTPRWGNPAKCLSQRHNK